MIGAELSACKSRSQSTIMMNFNCPSGTGIKVIYHGSEDARDSNLSVTLICYPPAGKTWLVLLMLRPTLFLVAEGTAQYERHIPKRIHVT